MAALGEFCECLKNCADKLEADIRININEFHNMVTEGVVDEVKLALDKAKDYHYKEIIRFMEDVVNNVRKIMLHEQEIRRLQRQEQMTDEERKRHSYVRRQIKAFNGSDKVTRREIRRAASERSINSLEAWELYLDKKAESGLSTSLPELVQKRGSNKHNRNQRKSLSIFDSILDNTSIQSQNLGNISEEDKADDEVDNSIADNVVVSRVKLYSDSGLKEDYHRYISGQNNDLIDFYGSCSFGTVSSEKRNDRDLENGDKSIVEFSNNFDKSQSSSRGDNINHSILKQSDDDDGVDGDKDVDNYGTDVNGTVEINRYLCPLEQSTSQTDGCERSFGSYKETDLGEPSNYDYWSDSECDDEPQSPCETETEKFTVIKLIKSLDDLVGPGDTKPKIIDVVYKHDISSKDPDGTG
ncbi:unnamed protein product [Acanthoscelides obtectus]|nr:unnamed protein product [Acanthoscelides obtectus]CAK1637748.1 hypothetical protein AOBTE_LOCUS10174 [Acanthoscelides obtectus]